MLTGGQREGDRQGEMHEWGQERREEDEEEKEGVTDVRKGIKVDGVQARCQAAGRMLWVPWERL